MYELKQSIHFVKVQGAFIIRVIFADDKSKAVLIIGA